MATVYPHLDPSSMTMHHVTGCVTSLNASGTWQQVFTASAACIVPKSQSYRASLGHGKTQCSLEGNTVQQHNLHQWQEITFVFLHLHFINGKHYCSIHQRDNEESISVVKLTYNMLAMSSILSKCMPMQTDAIQTVSQNKRPNYEMQATIKKIYFSQGQRKSSCLSKHTVHVCV